tara:strand:- start:5300 stop:5890 length:591 start_codon:yes stop_codon:yes gene_type:complete
MARNKLRSSLWGTARRSRITSKMSSPNPREGSEGDLEVRNTSLGARLFAKVGGRWLSNILHGNELDNPDVYIPKIWQASIDVPASEGSTGDSTVQKKIYLPDFINQKNFLCANWSIQWLNVGSMVTLAEYGLPTSDPAPEGRIDYNPTLNLISLREFNLHTEGAGLAYSSGGASGIAVDTDGDDRYAQLIVTVFFK